ncbi:MAG: hypothetical protein LBM98_12040 [Oscillospiraceae bacterium]|nr:hypothetical protein [Oscillospiraceae bacterium]
MLQVRSNPVPEGNIRTYRRCLRQPWIASPHIIDYVSQVRWRLRKDGQGVSPALSRRTAPGRWTGDASAHGAGHPPPLRRHPPLKRGGLEGRTGARPRTARGTTPALRATPPKRGIYEGGRV